MRDRPWFAPTITFVLAALLFSLNLDRPPHPDELHHVLAGQHLLDTGRPIIAEGEYWRGILYTWLVAISYAIFGEGLPSARLPAVLLVASIAPILFVWVRREAGTVAAWLVTTLFISSPFVVEIAQFSRFYCLQMMFFTLGALCVYYGALASRPVSLRIVLALLAVAFLGLSLWVQDTTIIGLAGIASWLVGAAAWHVVRRLSKRQAAWWGLTLGFALALALLLAATVFASELAWAWRRYRTASLFASGNSGEFWYYHLRYMLFYPSLWPLIGAFTLLAAMRNSRLAWFAATVFGGSFILTSFAAQKATRYFSYVQPLVAVVWGVGLAMVVQFVRDYRQFALDRMSSSIALPFGWGSPAAKVLVFAALAVFVLMNPFWLRTAAIIGNVAMPLETPAADWRAARGALVPWTSGAEIMITSEELGAIYFLGRSDVRYSPSKFAELPFDQRFEFGIDPRTGRPIITEPESLQRLITCFDSGFVVGPADHWGAPTLINENVQELIRTNAERIDVPPQSHLYAWGWKRSKNVSKPDYCSGLHRFSGLHRPK